MNLYKKRSIIDFNTIQVFFFVILPGWFTAGLETSQLIEAMKKLLDLLHK